MASIAEERLLTEELIDSALRIDTDILRSAPSATTITKLKSATDTSISMSVNPCRFLFFISAANTA